MRIRAARRALLCVAIRILTQSFQFDDDRLARAIAATFERRETKIPIELPDALTSAFAEDERKQRQWNAFLEDAALNLPFAMSRLEAGTVWIDTSEETPDPL